MQDVCDSCSAFNMKQNKQIKHKKEPKAATQETNNQTSGMLEWNNRRILNNIIKNVPLIFCSINYFQQYDYYVHYDYGRTYFLINFILLNKHVIKFIYLIYKNFKCVEAFVRLIYESIDLYNYIFMFTYFLLYVIASFQHINKVNE